MTWRKNGFVIHPFLFWSLLIRQQDDCLVQASKDDNEKPESWYKKYESYPPYCSIPDEMDSRSIPPLPDVPQTVYGETRILHATAVIRHGARTPYSSNEGCFPVCEQHRMMIIVCCPYSSNSCTFRLYRNFKVTLKRQNGTVN
jgi:hypothetical protein